jgi:hypothetical protein
LGPQVYHAVFLDDSDLFDYQSLSSCLAFPRWTLEVWTNHCRPNHPISRSFFGSVSKTGWRFANDSNDTPASSVEQWMVMLSMHHDASIDPYSDHPARTAWLHTKWVKYAVFFGLWFTFVATMLAHFCVCPIRLSYSTAFEYTAFYLIPLR